MRRFKTKKTILDYPAGTEIEVMVDLGRLGSFWDGWDLSLITLEKEKDWFEEITNDNT